MNMPGGVLGNPYVREFMNGRVDFYDQESINGKTIVVRFSIWDITPDTAESEQAFSDDGGKTWETNWVNRYARLAPQRVTSLVPLARSPGSVDFDEVDLS